MARSKYINTFNTTAEYNEYIESAYPKFPNVGYDKQTGNINIMRTSPNDHLIYGEVVDVNGAAPKIMFNDNLNYVTTLTIDAVSGTFYADSLVFPPSGTNITNFSFQNASNIKSIKKMNIDVSHVTYFSLSTGDNFEYLNFNGLKFTSYSSYSTSPFAGNRAKKLYLSGCFNNLSKTERMFSAMTNLQLLDINDCDFSNVSNTTNMFYYCPVLTDVYINIEGTLNKLTNNLTSQGNNYVPSIATIHYDNGIQVIDYKWQNNAWTPQS